MSTGYIEKEKAKRDKSYSSSIFHFFYAWSINELNSMDQEADQVIYHFVSGKLTRVDIFLESTRVGSYNRAEWTGTDLDLDSSRDSKPTEYGGEFLDHEEEIYFSLLIHPLMVSVNEDTDYKILVVDVSDE